MEMSEGFEKEKEAVMAEGVKVNELVQALNGWNEKMEKIAAEMKADTEKAKTAGSADEKGLLMANIQAKNAEA